MTNEGYIPKVHALLIISPHSENSQQVINAMELFRLNAWIVAIWEFSERNAKTVEDVALTTLFMECLGVSRVVPKNLDLWRDPLRLTGKYLTNRVHLQ